MTRTQTRARNRDLGYMTCTYPSFSSKHHTAKGDACHEITRSCCQMR